MPRRLLTFIAAQLLLCLSVIAQAQEDIPRLLMPDGLPSEPVIIDGGGDVDYTFLDFTLPEGYLAHPLAGGLDGLPSQIVDLGDVVYFIGDFTKAFNDEAQTKEIEVNGIARWVKATQQWEAVDLPTSHKIVHLVRDAVGALYAIANVYDEYGLPPSVYVFKLQQNEWQTLGPLRGTVTNAVLDELNNELYLQGHFGEIDYGSGDVAIGNLMKWDGAEWQLVGGGERGNWAKEYQTISYSKTQHGFYVSSRFHTVYQADGTALAAQNSVFWSIADQSWKVLPNLPVGTLTTSYFYELNDEDSVLASVISGKLHRFRWSDQSWTELGDISLGSSVLLPDEKRLISAGGYKLLQIMFKDDAAVVENIVLGIFYAVGKWIHSNTVAEDGLYIGLRSAVGSQYNYVVRLEIPDMDGDGVANADDHFPLEPQEWLDTDSDGIGDNSDSDIDGDGIVNEQDLDPYDPAVGLPLNGYCRGYTLSQRIYSQ